MPINDFRFLHVTKHKSKFSFYEINNNYKNLIPVLGIITCVSGLFLFSLKRVALFYYACIQFLISNAV